jgi:hypothetical protein
LITEDRKLHQKAAAKNLANRVYFIQTAEDWLERLHEPTVIEIPNIKEVELNELTEMLGDVFFDSFRNTYPDFELWFRDVPKFTIFYVFHYFFFYLLLT